MPPRRVRPLTCGCGPGWKFRVAIPGIYAAYVSIVYSTPSSGLYIQPERIGPPLGKYPGTEAWLWLSVLLAAASFFALQGSDPGRLPHGVGLSGASTDVRVFALPGDRARAATDDLESVALADSRAPSLGSGASRDAGGAQLSSLLHVPDDDDDDTAPASRAAPPPSTSSSAFAASGGSLPAGLLPSRAEASAAGVRQCPACACDQPARAHHCRDCDACVATFDHHCTMIGTCIGERNRARFFLFLCAHAAALSTVVALMLSAFEWRRETSEWLAHNALTLVTCIIGWAMLIFILGLTGFHAWCAATNMTTFEATLGVEKLWYLAHIPDKRECDIPFARSCVGNVRLFWCTLEAWDCYRRRKEGAARGDVTSCCGKDKVEWVPHVWVAEPTNRNAAVNESLWENQLWSCC